MLTVENTKKSAAVAKYEVSAIATVCDREGTGLKKILLHSELNWTSIIKTLWMKFEEIRNVVSEFGSKFL